MLEREYQARLIRKLHGLFPDCLVLKNDPDYLQGIPDLTIFFGDRWAMLEVKASAKAPFQPNQKWYVAELGKMSFVSVIYPEIEQEVLDALHSALRPARSARVPQRQ